MSKSLKEMYKNLNYYYHLTGPLHNHKTFDQQISQINDIQGNLTGLSGVMDEIKERLDGYENHLHNEAEENIKDGDYYMQMSEEQKNDLFDEAIVEFEKSLQIALKKLSIMKTKVRDMSSIMQEFKDSSG